MKYLLSKKNFIIAGLACGLVAVLLAYYGNPANMAICIACFIRDTAGALKLHSAPVVQYARPEIVGIVLGALIISLFRKEFRSEGGSSLMTRFLLGMIMVIGSLIFLGCPLRMVIRMANGDLNAYIALIGFVGGVSTGVFFLKRGYSLGKGHETNTMSGFVTPFLLVVILVLSITTSLLAISESGPGSIYAPIAISLAGGLIFGAFAQFARMCFAGAVRDSIFFKNLDKLIIILVLFVFMLIYNLISGSFNFGLENQPIAHTEWIWNIIGMYAVGFGAVLAGGCPLRQLVLTGQGSQDGAVTVLGMFAGAAISHNFGLASSGTGTTEYGRIAVLICIGLLFIVALFNKRKAA